MKRNFCTYNNTQFPTNATVCIDGLVAVCMSDGNWQKTATPCGQEVAAGAASANAAAPHFELNVSATLHTQLFPNNIILAAQNAQKATGCLTSVTLAQWALESGFGKYQMNANNPFGMKWYEGCPYGYVTVNTKEFINGHWIVVDAKFIAFPTDDDAFIEHGKLLMDPDGPYKAALPFKTEYKQFIEKISPIYATDPHYAKSLLSLIATYSLNRFDLPG